MIQQWLIKILLSPLAWLYGLGVILRNLLYQIGLFKSISFSFPVISMGNLSVGGTGKTPHIEFLILHLREFVRIGVLSRGYGRKTQGYRLVTTLDHADQSGDEPVQLKRKFPDVAVAVSESRALGIPQLLKNDPGIQLILLDDAYQHRAITPAISILLTDFNRPFYSDFLLPVGRLREWRSAYQRAHAIIVTKCPPNLPTAKRHEIRTLINPQPHQKLYFSSLEYGQPYSFWDSSLRLQFTSDLGIILISAIAHTDHLTTYLETRSKEIRHLEFTDHHFFTKFDMGQLRAAFDAMAAQTKIILTTEKDATRLELHYDYLFAQKLPIFVLPLRVRFLDQQDEIPFMDYIQQQLLAFTV